MMTDECKSMLNVELDTKISKSLIIKLSAIVGDDDMWEPIPIDYRPPEETLDLDFGDMHMTGLASTYLVK